MQTFPFPVFCDFVKKVICIFAFCVITFEPIKIQTCLATQNDCLNFSFVKGNWWKKWPERVEKRQLGWASGGGYHPRISSIE
jgi:hypothetical protein